MSTRPVVAAEPREIVGKSVSRLRRKGILPAVVYGFGQPSRAIQIGARDVDDLLRVAGKNALVDLKVGGGRTTPVLLQGVHEDPVRRTPMHVDFYVVKMTEEITVDVPVHVVGESIATTRLGGTLLHMRDAVQVRALPTDLPAALELDISSLGSFEDVLHVSDLVVPDGVTLVTDGAELLARVQPPRVEDEPVAGAEAPEVLEEGESAEGAPSAEGESASTEGSAGS
ncbi:50S ribosomal protein L25/general stress protein Ctc [soil metagenome]